jgi:hypothetical protein
MSDMHKELWQLHPKIEDADKREEVVRANRSRKATPKELDISGVSVWKKE